jgi:hypothetical protein
MVDGAVLFYGADRVDDRDLAAAACVFPGRLVALTADGNLTVGTDEAAGPWPPAT